MNKPGSNKRESEKSFGGIMSLFGLVALLLESNSAFAGELPPGRHEVEAVFLFNFAKYVEWPAAAFSNAIAPITIGLIGTDLFGDALQNHVMGKMVNGRPFVIKHLAADSELSECQILFIGGSDASRIAVILDRARALPILTVGESQEFAHNGGIISFVLKNGNVRLTIDLTAAKKAGLVISARLLAVADLVKGKTN